MESQSIMISRWRDILVWHVREFYLPLWSLPPYPRRFLTPLGFRIHSLFAVSTTTANLARALTDWVVAMFFDLLLFLVNFFFFIGIQVVARLCIAKFGAEPALGQFVVYTGDVIVALSFCLLVISLAKTTLRTIAGAVALRSVSEGSQAVIAAF